MSVRLRRRSCVPCGLGEVRGDVGLNVKAAYHKRDPRAFMSAPPGSLYRPTLSARVAGLARAAGRQAGAACFSALITSLVVMIAVSRNPALPDDYEPSESTPNTTRAYRQSDSRSSCADPWSD